MNEDLTTKPQDELEAEHGYYVCTHRNLERRIDKLHWRLTLQAEKIRLYEAELKRRRE